MQVRGLGTLQEYHIRLTRNEKVISSILMGGST